MEQHYLTNEQIAAFASSLVRAERTPATIEKYLRSVRAFFLYLDGQPVTKDAVVAWKEHLQSVGGYSPSTVNASLAAINDLFTFLGWTDCRAHYLKVQRRLFRDAGQELGREDYERLITAARESGRERIALVMETICATGIRVSEVRYITVEAAKEGRTTISLKGKIRTILLPGKLRRKLLKYAKKQKTASGAIFRTKSGKELGRRQIWAELKGLCKHAGVESGKVFPHNLRHLFATVFYRTCRDIAKLADLLGHSSIETTRIYLVTSGTEHQRRLIGLGLFRSHRIDILNRAFPFLSAKWKRRA